MSYARKPTPARQVEPTRFAIAHELKDAPERADRIFALASGAIVTVNADDATQIALSSSADAKQTSKKITLEHPCLTVTELSDTLVFSTFSGMTVTDHKLEVLKPKEQKNPASAPYHIHALSGNRFVYSTYGGKSLYVCDSELGVKYINKSEGQSIQSIGVSADKKSFCMVLEHAIYIYSAEEKIEPYQSFTGDFFNMEITGRPGGGYITFDKTGVVFRDERMSVNATCSNPGFGAVFNVHVVDENTCIGRFHEEQHANKIFIAKTSEREMEVIVLPFKVQHIAVDKVNNRLFILTREGQIKQLDGLNAFLNEIEFEKMHASDYEQRPGRCSLICGRG